MSELPGPLRLTSTFPFVGRSAELDRLRALMPSGEAARRPRGPAGRRGRLRQEPPGARVRRRGGGATARSCSTAPATPRCAPRTGRSWRRSTSWRGPPSPTSCGRRWAQAAASSRGCCPTSAPAWAGSRRRRRPTRTPSATGCTPPWPSCWPGSPGGGPCCSCSRTFTGPTLPRSSSCATSRGPGSARMLLLATFRDTEADVPDALSETLADLRRYDSIRLGLRRALRRRGGRVRAKRGGGGPGSRAAARWRRRSASSPTATPSWSASSGARSRRPGRWRWWTGRFACPGSPAELGSPESVREVVSQRLSRLAPRHQRPARAGGHGGGGVRARRGAARGRSRRAGAARGARRGGAQRHDRGVPARRDWRAGSRTSWCGGRCTTGCRDRGGRSSTCGWARRSRRVRATGPGGPWPTSLTTSPRPRRSARRRARWSTTCWPRARPPRRSPTTRRRRGCAPRWRWESRAPEERLEVSLELGQASHRAGKALDALAAYRAAAEIARELGDARALARAAIGYEDACWRPGMTDQGAVELLEEATAALGDEDSELRVGLLGGLARALDFQGHHDRGARSCARTRWRWPGGWAIRSGSPRC